MNLTNNGLLFSTLLCLLHIILASESIQNANISADNTTLDIKQTKRDLSYSYSAADIGSKEGTHIKTITVIKNIVGKKDKPIKVDAKLHDDENWGSKFRDNFDSFGKIPDIPDIDDLIGKKKPVQPKVEEPKKKVEEPKKKAKDEAAKPTSSDSDAGASAGKKELGEETAESDKREVVEKIPGEVELISTETANLKLKSQSLPQYSSRISSTTPLKRKVGKNNPDRPEGTQFLTQYSTPQHSVRQYFIQSEKNRNTKDSDKKSAKIIVHPCDRAYPLDPVAHHQGYPSLTGITINNGDNSGSVVKVTTPSGKSYDIPLPTTSSKPPYIAPSLKKTTNFNSSSDSNNNSNNINNNINIGRPSFNFNNFLGTQPVNIPVNQPVDIPINNPGPTAPAATPPPNATNLFPLNVPIGYQPNLQTGNNQQGFVPQVNQPPPNLVPGIPGFNSYNNNPAGYNPLFNKGYNPHANFPNNGFANNQPGYYNPVNNVPYNQNGVQGQQPAFNTPLATPVNQQPINPDTSAVTFPNLSDNILNNNNLIVQQNYNNKQVIPPQNSSAASQSGFSITNSNNLNLPSQPSNLRFVPTANKINYAIPYTNLPRRSNENIVVPKLKGGRSRGLRY